MKKLIIAALVLAAALPSFAGNYKLPKEEPKVVINIPSKWQVEAEDESIEASSEDDEIYIYADIQDSDSIEGAIQEAIGYLKKNKVKVDTASEKKTEVKINGMDCFDIEWSGEDEDGPCKCGLTVYGISDKEALLVLYWASIEGEKKHADDINKIFNTVKLAK